MNYVKLPQGVRDSLERECYNVNRVKEALRREFLLSGLLVSVFPISGRFFRYPAQVPVISPSGRCCTPDPEWRSHLYRQGR